VFLFFVSFYLVVENINGGLYFEGDDPCDGCVEEKSPLKTSCYSNNTSSTHPWLLMFAAVCPKNSNEWKVEGEIGGQIVSQTQTANAW